MEDEDAVGVLTGTSPRLRRGLFYIIEKDKSDKRYEIYIVSTFSIIDTIVQLR